MIWCCHKNIMVLSIFLASAKFLPSSHGFAPQPCVHHRFPPACLFKAPTGQPGIQMHLRFHSLQNLNVLHLATSTNQAVELDNDGEHDNDADDGVSLNNTDKDTEDDDVTTQQQQQTQRRRRRRKENSNNHQNKVNDNITVSLPSTVSTTTPEVVSIPIMDVRNLVDPTITTITTTSRYTTTSVSNPESIPQKQSNVATSSIGIGIESTVTDSPGSGSSTTGSNSSTDVVTTLYDPLEQLLLDVKEMRSMSDNSNSPKQLRNGNNNDRNNKNEGSILPENTMSLSKVLSTIVTVDFFIVLIFFLWFLLGIVGSYVFKDDTIQIAFNSNFQTLVQPALGILMIASISDAIFKDKEE